MSPKRSLLVAVCVSLLLSLTACLPSTDARTAYFYVSDIPQNGVPGYTPQGSGWLPSSQVEISIYNEPDGPGSASSQWRIILTEKVDAQGFFGFGLGPGRDPFYPINNNQKICGTPEQPVDFMAKSLTTGTFRIIQTSAILYFTAQPCP